MSMDQAKADKLKDKQAITCCRFEKGTKVTSEVLEDPNLIPDFVDSGLLKIPTDILTIGQVLNGTLKMTVDALTALTPENVEGYQTKVKVSQEEKTSSTPKMPITSLKEENNSCCQSVKINIARGENISLEFPINVNGVCVTNGEKTMAMPGASLAKKEFNVDELKREFKREYVEIKEVAIGNETKICDGKLTIDKKLIKVAVDKEELVKKMEIDIITEKDYAKSSNTIMDIQPIAVKMNGEVGSGLTRIIDKVVIMLTGIDEVGKQVGEFGSCEGELNRNIMWNRPGAPDFGDILIRINVVIRAHAGMERPGPLAAHLSADVITQAIREELKAAKDVKIIKTETFQHVRHHGKPKVLVVKEIMGQGAMHDNLILPVEPVGTLGAVPNVDLGNLPIALSPLEILDGGIHALTCIGPASKETSRHYFREPLILRALQEKEIDFVGSTIVGSPQVNSEKFYVSKRLGMMAEYMDLDGAIITTEGFGNNHIDFAAHHEEIGKRNVKVVGCTFAAQQGALVVGNEYMSAMIDNNKSKQGIENEILSNNTLCPEDAIRAIEMIKTVIANEEVEPAERKWTDAVRMSNISKIEQQTNIKFDLVKNEQILEKSKKRREIYEPEN